MVGKKGKSLDFTGSPIYGNERRLGAEKAFGCLEVILETKSAPSNDTGPRMPKKIGRLGSRPQVCGHGGNYASDESTPDVATRHSAILTLPAATAASFEITLVTT